METFQALVILVASHYAVPPECKALAQQRGYPLIMSESQAGRAVKVLNKYAGWPGVNACRAAVKRDWKL